MGEYHIISADIAASNKHTNTHIYIVLLPSHPPYTTRNGTKVARNQCAIIFKNVLYLQYPTYIPLHKGWVQFAYLHTAHSPIHENHKICVLI